MFPTNLKHMEVLQLPSKGGLEPGGLDVRGSSQEPD